MTRPVDDASVEAVVAELQQDLGQAEYRIERIADLDLRFRVATEMANLLQEQQQRFAALRGRTAVAIRAEHELDLDELGSRISSSRSRAYQLHRLGLKSLAEMEAKEAKQHGYDDHRGAVGGSR